MDLWEPDDIPDLDGSHKVLICLECFGRFWVSIRKLNEGNHIVMRFIKHVASTIFPTNHTI